MDSYQVLAGLSDARSGLANAMRAADGDTLDALQALDAELKALETGIHAS